MARLENKKIMEYMIMGTLLKQMDQILLVCSALHEKVPFKKDYINIATTIRDTVAGGFRVEARHIDDFINLICYLPDDSAEQRDKIIGLMEAFESQQNFQIISGAKTTDNGVRAFPHRALGA